MKQGTGGPHGSKNDPNHPGWGFYLFILLIVVLIAAGWFETTP